MILERDERSEGWVAYEGMWNPQKFEFERLRACFKCPERGALDDGSWMGWFVNRAADGAEPDWGIATMRCFSHWEREWNVLLFFSLLVNVFSVIVKAYDLKLFADAMTMICFFRFSGQWSGTVRDLEWNNASNHASAWVYLLSQCTTVRLWDLPLGDKIKPSILQRFQIGWTASLFSVFCFFIRMFELEKVCYASNVLSVLFACEFVLYINVRKFEMYIISACLSLL